MAVEHDNTVEPSPQPVESIEKDATTKKEDEGGDKSDGEGDAMDVDDGKISNDLYREFKAVTENLLNFKIKSKNSEEHFPSGLFKRLPNKRLLPDYYEIIKEPSAISTLRGKIQRKQYSNVAEFVRDFALVVHNAKLYNRPNSQPVRDVLKLEEIFKEELKRLVTAGYVTEEDVEFPDLGDIPYATPEPDPVSEEDEVDEDDEDDDEEAEDSDDDKRRRRRDRRGTRSGREAADDDDRADELEQKRRGRPPKVATPTEHRIDRIIKSLRKPKTAGGQPMIVPFERLPDKTEMPEYYQVIPDPMAYDILKRKAKRKKYASVDDLMRDIELMFKNAMHFNEDGSDIHTWAQELLAEAKKAEAEEKAKPDTEYLQAADGRIPLPYITYKGDTWKVGDWVHIQNPNDITKPIVAQIYRTWKTEDDTEWINACWYYRPEQTVHQYEKHFFPNEVVKTGQYRDHKIDEVLNKCFVMFVTRYNRGRPRGLPPNTEVYVCEARYNEDKCKFNKIKTWASCLPDEVRDKDYEMDLYDAPRKNLKKIPSPLLSRLKDSAKESDELPQPEWKHPNAPPVVGGIHKRPRDENQSPPPEPTPPPPVMPPAVTRTSSTTIQPTPVLNRQPSTTSNTANARPMMTSQPTSYANGMNNVNQYTRPNYTGTQSQNTSQTPSYPSQQVSNATHTAPPLNHYSSQNYSRPVQTPNPALQHAAHHNTTVMERTAEAYVLSSVANESIPRSLREQFPRDDLGRVLFFTQPPMSTEHMISGSTDREQRVPLRHSEKYEQARALRQQKQRERARGAHGPFNETSQSSSKRSSRLMESDSTDTNATRERVTANSMRLLNDQVVKGMLDEYKVTAGEDWGKTLADDLARGQERAHQDRARDQAAAEKRAKLSHDHAAKYAASHGRLTLSSQGYLSDWRKGFFSGRYLDDHDSRLPF